MSNIKNCYTKDNGELDIDRYYQDLLKHDPGYSEFLDRLNQEPKQEPKQEIENENR